MTLLFSSPTPTSFPNCLDPSRGLRWNLTRGIPIKCVRALLRIPEKVNGMNKHTLLLATLMLCAISVAPAKVVTIVHAGIEDHADPARKGSIAHAMATHGANNTYIVRNTNKDFSISSPINLPDGCTLSSENSETRIVASGELDDKPMIVMGNDCVVERLTLDAARHARNCIFALGNHDIAVQYCTLGNTKNDYDGSGTVRRSSQYQPHILHLNTCRNIRVAECVIENAGCNPKPTVFDSSANGIYAPNARHLEVLKCRVSQTLGANILISRAFGVLIDNNVLQYSGQIANDLDGDGFPDSDYLTKGAPEETKYRPDGLIDYNQDGIIAYHNSPPLEFVTITNNTITSYTNHGIHLSGRHIRIENNTIHDGNYCGIRIDDQQKNPECSSDITITNNSVAYGNVTTNTHDPLFVSHFRKGTVHVSNNKDYRTGLAHNRRVIPGYCE